MKNKFIKIKTLFIMTILLSSCIGSETKFYLYNTQDYINFVNKEKFIINEEQAFKNAATFIYKENEESSTIELSNSIISDEYYIFLDIPINWKINAQNLSGIWVNGKTGETQRIKNDKMTKINLILTEAERDNIFSQNYRRKYVIIFNKNGNIIKCEKL